MTKILIFIPWFDPAFKAGGPIQSITNLVHQFDQEVSYFIFCSNKDVDGSILLDIDENCWVDYNDCTKVWYCAVPNPIAIAKKIVAIEKPDVIFTIGLFSWQYNILPNLLFQANRKIISVRGMLHPGALSQKTIKKKIFLAVFKLLRLQHQAIFHCTNSDEELHVKNIFGQQVKTKVADNFPKKLTAKLVAHKFPEKLVMMTIALISPMKNHLLTLQALKSFDAQITYHIVGAIKDNQYWAECQKIIEGLPNNIKVIYHGEVSPHFIAEYLEQTQIFIMPSKSENYGHAIIEALIMGKPVITSFFTPWKNLEQGLAGMNVDCDAQQIALAINHFAQMEQSTYDVWCEAAINYANDKINYEHLHQQYRSLFFNLDA